MRRRVIDKWSTSSSTTDKEENSSKCQKLELSVSYSLSNDILEADIVQEIRRRTFSHWPHRTILSSAQMIEAGFFNCNMGDRVICIYCNLICQQWTPHIDDPCEVHKILSPNCAYVKAKLIRPSASSITIVNESSPEITASSVSAANFEPLRSNEIVFTAACNPSYAELPKRRASFATCSHQNSPSVENLARAGFFYTDTKSIVTCFYCNGSLQNWGPNDNPTIEHARWFPHCAYAKQLCGDEMHRKIQESKRAQQERARADEAKEKANAGIVTNNNSVTNSRQLLISDDRTLARLVAERLDRPISQRLLDENFKLSVIKRCWEDQLRLKQDDFASETDLYMACLILQKQIEYIDGKKENIIIPSIKMKEIRERNEAATRESLTNTTRTADDEMTTSSQSLTNESSTQSSVESTAKPPATSTQNETKTIKTMPTTSASEQDQTAAAASNPSVLCLIEEKSLACIPCGHLATCTRCSQFLRLCPHCGVQCANLEAHNDSLRNHRVGSESCPFVFSKHPINPSSAPTQTTEELFTKERVDNDLRQPTSHLILTSTSPFCLPTQREESFRNFPSEPPKDIEGLVRSGFYYTGVGTTLQCYGCGATVHNWHHYLSNEIDIKHRNQFPNCRFAQLLPRPNELQSTNDADSCKWCFINPKTFAAYPCMHLAVCGSCTQLIKFCPVCDAEVESFFKLYM